LSSYFDPLIFKLGMFAALAMAVMSFLEASRVYRDNLRKIGRKSRAKPTNYGASLTNKTRCKFGTPTSSKVAGRVCQRHLHVPVLQVYFLG
jgi:hypothetical protein